MSKLPIMLSSATFNWCHQTMKIITQTYFPLSRTFRFDRRKRENLFENPFSMSMDFLSPKKMYGNLLAAITFQSNILHRNLFSIEMIFRQRTPTSSVQLSLPINTTTLSEQICLFETPRRARVAGSWFRSSIKRLKTNFTDKTVSVNITKRKIWILWDFSF